MPRLAAPNSAADLPEAAAETTGGGRPFDLRGPDARAIDLRGPDARGAEPRPVDALHGGGLELSNLSGYFIVVLLLVVCGLIHASNRVDRRETSMDIEATRAKLGVAIAEQERLKLELATLQDPENLRLASQAVGMDSRPKVIDLAPEATP
jgi:hypothetical protein